MNKTVVIIIAMSVLILGAMGGGFFLMWSKMSSLEAAHTGAEIEEEAGEAEAAGIGALFPLDTFIVNLADEGGKRYLRVSMNLELKSTEMTEEFNKRLPQIRDVILMVLPTKRFEDVRTVEGKTALRGEIMSRLNELLKGNRVSNIYFTEFVIQ
ncbi:MAG: flagellar basal body-associated FliL family protein [Desulfobacterales bacterium]|jgi:flagellar FliL protein